MVYGRLAILATVIGLAGPAAAQEDRLGGFHIGIFGGEAILDSTVTIPATATSPGAVFVDQGGDGFIFGARAGWGRLVTERAYLGIEGEAIVPYNVTSRLNALGVEYRARLRNEFGVYGRIGYAPARDGMVYFRAGLTVPRQSFQSTGGQDGADWTLVPAFGVGGEIHVTHDIALRVDATYSVPSGANRIESWRLTGGILWRFSLGGR
ncbi:hypothetical protein [Roseomonas sp. HF4]|uniref:hypothetical protein n=1 Tax=Roseomonas sp. HF4 TaxID=2562313 RepID=UPI0010C09236|nr:hypothetical protein [Roseomonas sp. HF4]